MFSVLTSSCERALTFLCFQPALGPELNEMGSGIGGGGKFANTETFLSVDLVMPPLPLEEGVGGGEKFANTNNECR